MQSGIFLELHVPDFQKAIDFWKLFRFTVVQVRDNYLIMKDRQGGVIFFYPGSEDVYKQPYFKNFSKNTKRGYGVEIVLYRDNIQELYKKIQPKVKIVSKLKLQPWGDWDFRVEDPFGYYVRIGEYTNLLEDKEANRDTPKFIKSKGLKI